MKNLKLIIEYEGTNYHGWQRQKGALTIQGVIEDAIYAVLKKRVKLISSGRTDAGVHALGQIANFHTESSLDAISWQRALNSLLPQDIVIKKADFVPLDFHSRYSANGKVYRYVILNSPLPSVFYRNYAWHIPYPLNLRGMRKGMKYLKGTHDFSSFRAVSSASKNPIRTIKYIEMGKRMNFITIIIEADGFLHHMVRNIVGTLVEVGRRKIEPEEVKHILVLKDRRKAGPTAPPHGLYLVEVKY